MSFDSDVSILWSASLFSRIIKKCWDILKVIFHCSSLQCASYDHMKASNCYHTILVIRVNVKTVSRSGTLHRLQCQQSASIHQTKQNEKMSRLPSYNKGKYSFFFQVIYPYRDSGASLDCISLLQIDIFIIELLSLDH